MKKNLYEFLVVSNSCLITHSDCSIYMYIKQPFFFFLFAKEQKEEGKRGFHKMRAEHCEMGPQRGKEEEESSLSEQDP